MWKLSYFFVDIERNERRNKKKNEISQFLTRKMVVESTKRECSEKKHS